MATFKKGSLLYVLESVALNRIETRNEDTTIRVSYVFMQKIIKEFIDFCNVKANPSDFLLELHIIFYGKEFRVEHRIYRDDGNDSDVDEQIIKLFIEE